MALDSDSVRLRRLKERSTIKRDGYVSQIRSMYALAQRSLEDVEVSHQLFVAVDNLDDLWSSFSIEDGAVLDHLLALGLSSEYSNYLGTEMREFINFCKATATRFPNHHPEPNHTSDGIFQRDDGNGQSHNMRDFMLKLNIGSSINAGLPTIPLPTYNDDIYKWPSFRDRFVSLVDQRPHLSTIDKYYYLIGCLKGPASDAISGIPISEATYPLAWTTLEARFDKPRLVTCSLIDNLLRAPVSSTETLFDMNNFVSTFDESISILESLRVPNLGDFILFSLASRCLPVSCRTLFESQSTAEYPTVRELITFVKSRVSVLECVQNFNSIKPAQSSCQLKPASSTAYVKRFSKTVNSPNTLCNECGGPD